MHEIVWAGDDESGYTGTVNGMQLYEVETLLCAPPSRRKNPEPKYLYFLHRRSPGGYGSLEDNPESAAEAKAQCEADYAHGGAKALREIINEALAIVKAAGFHVVEKPQDKKIEATSNSRKRLPDRRRSETFDFDVPSGTAVLHYTATIGLYPDGGVGELFLNNHKSNSTADTNARDAAIAFSFAVQHGANIEDIRKALCREADGRASGPLGVALDLLSGARQSR